MSVRSRGTLCMLAGALAVAASLHACSQYERDERTIVQTPGSASFRLVGVMLNRRCGTLDCHGSPERNLRLYGQVGLRLDDADRPGSSETTNAELLASFQSVVGLEPEALTRVVQEGGAHPERLLLVRKARGTEHHDGGALMAPRDDQDTCLVSWLTGRTNEAACARAIARLDPRLDQP